MDISNNPIFHFDKGLFEGMGIKVLITNYSYLCCIKPADVLCRVNTISYPSCSNLFPNLAVKQLAITVTSTLILLNILSFSFHVWSDTKKRQHNSRYSGIYEMFVYLINCGALILGISLAILCIVDIYYSNTFMIIEYHWIKSLICSFLFMLNLLFNLTLPYMCCFLSLVRLLV